jgi:transcriptional regulator with XRE-family HTH domain
MKIQKSHILNATPPQIAQLMGVTSSAVYLWLQSENLSVKIGSIEFAANRCGVGIDEFWKILKQWISEEKQRRKLQHELEDLLNSEAIAA